MRESERLSFLRARLTETRRLHESAFRANCVASCLQFGRLVRELESEIEQIEQQMELRPEDISILERIYEQEIDNALGFAEPPGHVVESSQADETRHQALEQNGYLQAEEGRYYLTHLGRMAYCEQALIEDPLEKAGAHEE